MGSALHRSALQDGSCLNSCAYACGLFHAFCEISITLWNKYKRKHKKKESVSFSCAYTCAYFTSVHTIVFLSYTQVWIRGYKVPCNTAMFTNVTVTLWLISIRIFSEKVNIFNINWLQEVKMLVKVIAWWNL